jgi:hypothetical protein
VQPNIRRLAKSKSKQDGPPVPRDEGKPALDYLKTSESFDGLTALFIAYAVYDRIGGDHAGHGIAAVLLLGAALSLLLQRPRWVAYSLVCAAFILSTYTAVLIDANGPQDAQADRDDTIETGARTLLALAECERDHEAKRQPS